SLALQRRHVSGRPEQRGEVPAGRGAPDADAVRIETEDCALAAEEANGAFTVVDLRREDRFSTEAILNTGAEVAALREGEQHGEALVFVAPIQAPPKIQTTTGSSCADGI